ncbi:hypothetical protein I5M82_09200 [Serratia marcescens]|nr:hypothetical protein [Serratia marcescens]
MSNAVKHAVPASEIILSASPFPGGISVNVTNRGEAIPQQQQEKIFDRFYRADPSRHNSTEASGLGLAIVRSIMQLHQGTCRVGSEYGTTTFGLCFPDAPTTDRNV